MSLNFSKFDAGVSLEPKSADPTNPMDGDVFYSNGTPRAKGLWQYKDGAWSALGGAAGGSYDTFYQENFLVTTSANFTSGNNATFLGGGTLSGTLANDTSTPIAGTRSILYTQAAGSLNDYIALPAIPVELKERGNTVGVRLAYTYNGLAGDIVFVAHCVTNSLVLTSTLDTITPSSAVGFFNTSFTIPSNCTSLRIGFQVKTLNSGKAFKFDDIELSTNPFIYQNTVDQQSLQYTALDNTLQDRSNEVRFAAALTTASFSGPTILTVEDDAANTRTKFTAVRKMRGVVSFQAVTTAVGQLIVFWKNGTIIHRGTGTGSGSYVAASMPFTLDAGEYLTVGSDGTTSNSGAVNINLSIVAESDSQAIITPAKSNITEMVAYTPTFNGLGSPPLIEVFWHREGQILIGEGKITTGTVSAAEMRIGLPTYNGAQLLTASTRYIPSICPKGEWFRGGSQTSHGGSILAAPGLAYVTLSSAQVFGNGSTDPLTSALGNAVLNSGDQVGFRFEVPIEGWTSDAIFLAAVPVPRVAFLKDLKTSGTASGNFPSGSDLTRDLNSLTGDTSFIALASNSFTVAPGKYLIEGFSKGYAVNQFQAWIRNTTDSTDDIIGSGGRSDSADGTDGNSVILGAVEFSSPKVFQLRFRVAQTNAVNGGGAAAGFGRTEVYSQLKITKLR